MSAPAPQKAAAPLHTSGAAFDLSGPEWCIAYPTSVALEDLVEPFQSNVRRMLDSLTAGGARHTIAATRRPAERAYLMHFACMIAGGADPESVPAMNGVPIDWTHGGNIIKAKSAAEAMQRGYRIAYPAALVSRHTQGRAIDMNIIIPPSPRELYRFKDGNGQTHMFGGEDLQALYKFGKTFGVIKLVSDAPHWSDDGH